MHSWPRAIPPFLLLCLLSLGIVGCSSLTSETPPLADSTFSRVLVDLHLASARAQKQENVPPNVSDSVLAYHGIDRTEFNAALRYYSRRPTAFEAVYKTVMDSLNAVQDIPTNPRGIPDSDRRSRRDNPQSPK